MEAPVIAAARTRVRVPMVLPPRLAVGCGVADLRAEPRDDAELVDQLHYGTPGAILARRGGWAYIQTEHHYFGWIRERDAAASATAARAFRVIAVLVADVHARPDADSPVVDQLPAGAWLASEPKLDRPGWMWLPNGWLRLEDSTAHGDLVTRSPTATDLIRTAEAFLGVPYLWGGTSALGMDCSGYVQQVYRLNGMGLDRDADQQATLGRPVERAHPGDLIFFGAKTVTHVALSVGGDDFLNAPDTGRVVERGSLGAGRNVLAIRRYLMDESS